jgi:hypothetical protein
MTKTQCITQEQGNQQVPATGILAGMTFFGSGGLNLPFDA